MTSYEIGSNSSRYPYDYSFVTDGTNGEYTDTTESNFILPIITGADADKFLQVNAQATGYEYTEIEGELPPQAGQAGKFLETNGTSVFWDTVNQVPGVTGGVAGQYLTNDGSTYSWGSVYPELIANGILRTNNSVVQWQAFTASTSNFLRADGAFSNVRQVPQGGTAGWMLRTTGTGSEWNGNLVTSSTFTTVSQPLLAPDGSTSAPSYSFTNATTSGIIRTLVGTDIGIGLVAAGNQVCSVVGGNFRLSGGSTIRNNVSNPSSNIQFIGATGGATGNIQMSFVDNSSDIVNTATYRLGNGDNFQATETVMSRLRTTGTNEIFVTEHGNTYFRFLGATGTGANLPVRVQRVEINNSGMIINGTLDLGSTGTNANPSLTFGDTTVPRSGIYGTENVINFCTDGTERMRIGQNFNDHYQAVTTNQRFQSPDGDTGGYRFANTGDNRIVCNSNVVSIRANTVNTLSVSSTTATVTGNLVVTGTISGSISTPQVAKKTVVIASNSSTAYVYDSGNTGPATTLISVSISNQKNITLGNMGQSYDGFEFEFMLLGDLNNFGVAVTLSLAGSYVKVKSGAIGIVGSTAGQVHTFSRPMNEFRITGVFVWNGGTPYWVVVDRGVYKQRATNDIFAGGTGTSAYKVTRSTPEDLLTTRDSDTTIDFLNLVTEGGGQEDYDGFNFWISSSAGVAGNLSFKNSTSTTLSLTGGGGVTTINAGNTLQILAANAVGSCYRCIFRNNSGFKWFIYAM